MALVFDHAVKYNGKYYPAGTEIPEPAQDEPVQEPAEDAQDAENTPEPAEDEEMSGEKQEAPKKATKSRKKGDA